MNRRSFLTWASSISLLGLFSEKSVQACADGGDGLTIPFWQLPQIAQSSFQEIVKRQYPQLNPDAIRNDSTEILIRVPQQAEHSFNVPSDVSVNINDKEAYCKKLHVYGQSEHVILRQMQGQRDGQNNSDREWTYLIASYTFNKECLPYCDMRFRLIGFAMYIGVVAEIEYFDKSKVGPRYLAAISTRIKGSPCALVVLSST